MSMSMSTSIDCLSTLPAERQCELLGRHRAFWAREPGSAALIGYAPSSRIFPLTNLRLHHEGPFTPELITREVMDADARYRPPVYETDDLLPGKIPLEAIEWSQGYTGARLFMSSAAQTVWAEPGTDHPTSITELADRLQPAWLAKLVETTQYLAGELGETMLLSESLLRGPADCLEALVGAERLCLELYDNPERTAEMADWLAERVIELARAQIAVLPRLDGGTINRYRLGAPGSNIVTQADIANVMSPAHFRKVFCPAYRRIARAFDTATIHFHSCAWQHVDALLEIPELAAIEWGMDPTGPTLEEMVPVFARILEEKCVILMNIRTEAETAMLLDRLPHEGLCIIRRKD